VEARLIAPDGQKCGLHGPRGPILLLASHFPGEVSKLVMKDYKMCSLLSKFF
jgi:hypothetical protein